MSSWASLEGNVLTQDMVRSMAPNPIVFALANPVPEISYEDALASRPDVLISTGRSDYPNQINNVIGFPTSSAVLLMFMPKPSTRR